MRLKSLCIILHSFLLPGIIVLALLVVPKSPVYAQDAESNKQELVNLVHEKTGDYWHPLIVKKLMHYKLSPAWWSKILEKDGWGVTKALYFADNINEYAKRNGWGDVSQIEYRNMGPKEEAKPRVEAMLDGWCDKVSFTLQAESPTCTTNAVNLGLKYMSSVGNFLYSEKWTPNSGSAFITLVVSPTAHDISVAISKDGKYFTVTAPQELEPAEWDTKMARGLKRGGPQI